MLYKCRVIEFRGTLSSDMRLSIVIMYSICLLFTLKISSL